MSRTQTLSHEQVAEVGRCQKLLPTEAQFVGRKGYRRKYRPDGTYEWRYSYTTNVKGVLTREANEVLEMMRPFSVADTDRHARREAQKERVAMRDRDGRVSYHDAERADAVARTTGRLHVWRAGGERVIFGPEGMGFVMVRYEWQPTGKTGVGLFAPRAARNVVQHDPDGDAWRWRGRKWQRAD